MLYKLVPKLTLEISSLQGKKFFYDYDDYDYTTYSWFSGLPRLSDHSNTQITLVNLYTPFHKSYCVNGSVLRLYTLTQTEVIIIFCHLAILYFFN